MNYNPYQTPMLIEAPPMPTNHNFRWLLVCLLIVAIIQVLMIGGGLVAVYTEKPPANIDVPTGENAYMKLWGAETTALPDHYTVQNSVEKMRAYSIYFLWDTYPKLEEVAEASNLALKWPPTRGTRYRLAAYPFLQATNDILPLAILKAVFKMTNKYADVATPPAWYVSVYDENDWTRDNIFMPENLFNGSVTAGSKDSDTTYMRCRCSDTFKPFKWIEVVRTCYPVTKDSYPLCDDGGQWYYHAPGSGTWYNIGNCVVRYNKIDAAVYCMALMGVASCLTKDITLESIFGKHQSESDLNYPTQLLPVTDSIKSSYATVYSTLLDTPGCILSDYQGAKLWSEFWTIAKSHFVKRLKNNLGEKSIIRSISRLIKDAKTKDIKALQVQGFLPFQAFYSKEGAPLKGYIAFVASIAGIFGLLVAFLISFPACLFGQCSFLIPLLTLCLVGASGWLGWEYGLDAFISSQGTNMVTRGLDLYSITPEEVVDMCVEPTLGAQDTEKQQFFSGLPSSWIADMSIELFASMLGFDVVVMHTQPNKSGTYLVEMCDVTKIKLDFGLSPGQPSWWKGGTCGNEDVSGQDFACDSCPFPKARDAVLKSRGGLCFKNLGVPNFDNNYMTMNWQGEKETPKGPNVATYFTKSIPDNGNFTSNNLAEMKTWLTTFNAVVCTCRESKDALCIGCEGNISDVLCNWAQRASPGFTSPGVSQQAVTKRSSTSDGPVLRMNF